MKSLDEARNEAKKIIRKATATAGAVGTVPFSTLLLAGLDAVVIKKVADAFGVTEYSIEQALGVAAKSYAGKMVAYTAIDLVPFAGWVVKGGVAATMS